MRHPLGSIHWILSNESIRRTRRMTYINHHTNRTMTTLIENEFNQDMNNWKFHKWIFWDYSGWQTLSSSSKQTPAVAVFYLWSLLQFSEARLAKCLVNKKTKWVISNDIQLTKIQEVLLSSKCLSEPPLKALSMCLNEWTLKFFLS